MSARNPDLPAGMPRTVAVIDIGASAIRMAIAEILKSDAGDDPVESIRVLESLSQSVNLGKDAFTHGRIERSTIEDCVHVLRIYRQKLAEYGIDRVQDIRVVATSAVREASNRLAFLDRVFIATGFEIEPFDAAELHRATYLGIHPYLVQLAPQPNEYSIVCEVGGGSTEMLVLTGMDIGFAHTFRTGALRIRRSLEALHVPLPQQREMVRSQIGQMIAEIQLSLPARAAQRPNRLIAMGGEMRFLVRNVERDAAAEFGQQQLVELELGAIREFIDEHALLPAEKLMQRLQLSLPEAQALCPSLLAYEAIIADLGLDMVLVAQTNMRDGLLTEMAASSSRGKLIEEQILQSVLAVGRKFNFHEKRALAIGRLCSQLFEQLKELHELDQRQGFLLYVAAILHEIGLYVASRGYHKHSMYLINHSEFFGLSAHDTSIIGLIARYHRRAFPQSTHDAYGQLPRRDRVAISKMAALLRVARALDAQHIQRIEGIECRCWPEQVMVTVEGVSDLAMERYEMKQCNQFFEAIYGRRVVLVEG